jgi:predicted nucleic acid-binding protein
VFLLYLEVDTIKTNIDRAKIHDSCLRYSLKTPDALHVLAAQNCKYLVTTDDKLKTV